MNALEDADLTWDDIEAVIIGKAPDMFEGVIMPESYLTDALGCNGKPMLRVHTAGSVGGSTALVAASHVQSGTLQARADGDLRETVRVQCHVGAVHSPAFFRAPQRRRRRLLRAHHPRVYAPLQCALRRGYQGGGEGSPARCAQPAGAPATAEYHHAGSGRLHDAVGPDPFPRGLSLLGRRLRHGDRQRGTGGGVTQTAGLDSRRRHALGAHHVCRAARR